MKKIATLLFIVSSFAFAANTVQLDKKVINLGDLGDVRKVSDFDKKGEFDLVRTEKTPTKVKLVYSFKAPTMVCAQTRIVSYPCGGFYRGGYGRGGYGRGGYPYPPRGGYGRGGYYPGICTRSECVRYEERLYTQVKKLKLNFKKANAISGADVEMINLNLRSNGRSAGYDVQASDYTNIKQRARSIKFKN